MGRFYYDQKQEADGLNQIHVSFLKKHGYFKLGWHSGTITWTSNWGNKSSVGIQSNVSSEENYIRFIYTQTDRDTGEKKDFNYKISLTTTPCYFGGSRFWFICSASKSGVYCGKRVGTLYKAGDFFACRHCYDLTYSSRNLSGVFKSIGNILSIQDLQKLELEVKRKYYNGKPTKRFLRYKKKELKSLSQLEAADALLDSFYKNR